jgi:hypothetical protein
VTATAWEVRSSPSRGAILNLQLKNHCPARALVEGGIRDRWSPGGRSGWGHTHIYEASPWDCRCMSEFGDRTDVQQIRTIALVMITVLPGSANNRPLAQCKMTTEAAAVEPVILPSQLYFPEILHSRSDYRDRRDAAVPAPVYAGASTTCRSPLRHIPVYCHGQTGTTSSRRS